MASRRRRAFRSTTSQSQVERIEVTKGPTAEHSAQAVAGTIDVVLREAPRQRQRELRLGSSCNHTRPTFRSTPRMATGWATSACRCPCPCSNGAEPRLARPMESSSDVTDAPLHLLSRSDDRWWGDGFNSRPRLSWRSSSDTDTLNWQTFAQVSRFNNAGHSVSDVLVGLAPSSVNDIYGNDGQWRMLRRRNLQLIRRWADGSQMTSRQVRRSRAASSAPTWKATMRRGTSTVTRLTTGDNREHIWSSAGELLRPRSGERRSLAIGWDIEQKQRRELRSLTENGQSPNSWGTTASRCQAHIQARGAVCAGRVGDRNTVVHLHRPARRTDRHHQSGQWRQSREHQPGGDTTLAPQLQARPQGPGTWSAPA